jgi:hypothetical protein
MSWIRNPRTFRSDSIAPWLPDYGATPDRLTRWDRFVVAESFENDSAIRHASRRRLAGLNEDRVVRLQDTKLSPLLVAARLRLVRYVRFRSTRTEARFLRNRGQEFELCCRLNHLVMSKLK